MYDELICRLRAQADEWCPNCCYKHEKYGCLAPIEEKHYCDSAPMREAADILEKLSEQNTVVHCKDCKYCEHTLKRPNVWMPNETSEDHYNCMRIEDGTKPIVFPDSFCSFGKRGEMRVTL